MKAIGMITLALLVASCDSESIKTTPADYERAKTDCAAHAGLVSVETVLVMFRPTRVDSTCADGTRISRNATEINP